MNAAAQEFELPWPPSVNHYYRHVGPRVLISRDGRRYREKVVAIIRASSFQPLLGKISLKADFYPPDRRRRDLDNVGGKVLIDTLQAAGLFRDDCQIKHINLEMHDPMPPAGMAHIKVKEWTEDKTTHADAK